MTPRHGIHLLHQRQLFKKVYNGYSYVCNRIRAGVIYLVCKSKVEKNCKGTGKLIDDIFYEMQAHNHEPDPSLELIESFTDQLYQATVSSAIPLRQIYEVLRLLHPEAAEKLTYGRIRRTMFRWRQQVQKYSRELHMRKSMLTVEDVSMEALDSEIVEEMEDPPPSPTPTEALLETLASDTPQPSALSSPVASPEASPASSPIRAETPILLS